MKYDFTHLTVIWIKPKDFRLDQMREAVEHLKTIPDTGYTGLQASVTVEVGMYKLLAQPIIPLSQILGKKPSEVWEMFDKKVDESIASHDRRWNGTFRV